MWLVEAEFAHPIWHSYAVVVVHLRDTASFSDATIYKPGATHEFWVFALDPDKRRQEIVDMSTDDTGFLTPMNFGAQLIAGHDSEAIEMVKASVVEICNGTLSPDTDFRSAWVERWGDDMVKPAWRSQ